ncbi:Uncharacterised protein [Cutibacterium granulosum]|uniref:Uncharacterized protein n=1 Tax=Cutibacterium granulosum TaxID=33011 RepID=A0A239WUM0_9ACTN|nr:hypothetical protein [Cutibacterium granulosum]KAG9059790.1 hypothetical protein L860_000828 [Cutibacterium granulosum DSM 20700]SNV37939.1 Uncharacterised protein [Cutibacterium granulosum]
MSTPNGWDEALVAAGFTDRRSGKGPSWTALAEAIDRHPSTLTAMKDGSRRTDQATIDAVAKALHLDPRLIAEWAGRRRAETEPYRPPPEANLLDKDERDAIDRVIALLARPKMQGSSSDDQPSEDQKSPLEVAGRGEMTLAARRTRQPKGIRLVEQDQAGEENQDPGGWDEA